MNEKLLKLLLQVLITAGQLESSVRYTGKEIIEAAENYKLDCLEEVK